MALRNSTPASIALSDALSRSVECCGVAAARSPYITAKAILDRVVGLILLVISLPVIAVLVLAIRLTSRGPGIYSQVRVGREGRRFTMYKLRTMRTDAEVRTGPVWATAGCDPRVTRLGHWLRMLHLDELPQLYNLVRGEMSLVGPRPERPEFVRVLAEKIPGYLDRLQVLPGITGLAQINLPADTDLDSVRAKLQLDQEYIRSTGLWFDLRIALCTMLRLVGLRGGRAVSLLGLRRVVVLAPSSQPKDVLPAAVASPPSYTTLEVPVVLQPSDALPDQSLIAGPTTVVVASQG
jgi:lipopolysaccharide/colanic/teichoic acid biosynthesis glycosyltransferase